MSFEIIMQLHGKKSGGSSQSYKPTEEEKRLWKLQGDFQEAVNPYGINLIQKSSDVLTGSLGEQQYDFKKLDANAQKQIIGAQQGIANLTQGLLPAVYQKNMENSIRSGVQNTMGTAMDSLGARGVLNSAVTNTVMNDIDKNVADTMAQQYQNNIGVLNGLYGQQSQLATEPISAAAAAQEAALSPSLSLLNAALGVGSSNTGAVQSLHGTGTTTTTSSTGSNWLNGVLGAGSSIGSAMIACFTDDTDIDMADGTKRKIRLIVPGDKIMGYDVAKDDVVPCTVKETMQPRYSDIYVVVINKNGKRKIVYTTLTQPLLDENNQWKLVSEINIGTGIKGVGNVSTVAFCGQRKVYDLKIDGADGYFANGFIAKGGTEEW